MREILFRGKTVDNKNWIYGYIVEQSNPEYHTYIIRNFLAEIDKENIDVTNLDIAEVDSKTVGQYTGFKDKNGNKIFKGDIVDFPDRCDDDGYGVVVYETDETEVAIVYDSVYVTLGRYCHSRDIEVIGNIYDNLELMKGDENND